jgi:hypothetical protein
MSIVTPRRTERLTRIGRHCACCGFACASVALCLQQSAVRPSYSETPVHQLHKAVVASRVVDIDTRTGGLKYGGALPSPSKEPRKSALQKCPLLLDVCVCVCVRERVCVCEYYLKCSRHSARYGSPRMRLTFAAHSHALGLLCVRNSAGRVPVRYPEAGRRQGGHCAGLAGAGDAGRGGVGGG